MYTRTHLCQSGDVLVYTQLIDNGDKFSDKSTWIYKYVIWNPVREHRRKLKASFAYAFAYAYWPWVFDDGPWEEPPPF